MGWPLQCAECGTVFRIDALFRVGKPSAICPHCDYENRPPAAMACPYCHHEDAMSLTHNPVQVDWDLPYVCEQCLNGIDGFAWPYKPPDTTDPLVDGGIWPYPSNEERRYNTPERGS